MGKENTTDAKGEPAVASTALLACPFCGGKASVCHDEWIACDDCGAMTGAKNELDLTWAIGAWNKRANTKGEARCASQKETMSEKQTVDAGNSLPQPLGSPAVEPNVIRATVRDADDELHIECRFSDGQKFAAVRVDSDFPELANRIASFLSATAWSATKRSGVRCSTWLGVFFL